MDLEERWTSLCDAFGDAIASYGVPAAGATARLAVEGLTGGRPIALADAQIAGIRLSRGASLATRNVRHFADVNGLSLLNPFDQM